MDIKILSPLWGHEGLEYSTFLEKIRGAGYDGFDLWIPERYAEQRLLFDFLQKHDMSMVAHQHSAAGSTFKKFKTSYAQKLYECAAAKPLLINSHTGRDYFSPEQNIALIDVAAEVSAKTGIDIVHETHRGRLGYSPQTMHTLFNLRHQLRITADFSHWTCVTESMLEHFEDILNEAILRARHVHARVGYQQGPQVPDPRAPEWQDALQCFLRWWDRIVELNADIGTKCLTFTTEFGPVPYMPTVPFINRAVADQFEINCFMKNLLRDRYRTNQ